MANGEDSAPAKVGVVVLGTLGSLRNPDLQFIHPNVRFSPPVYLPSNAEPNVNQRFYEYLLNGRVLNQGERGCSQAHITLRTEILSSHQSWTLVLEDDVGVPLDWFTRVCSLLPGFPEDAAPGVILLNTNPHFNLGNGLVKMNLQPSGANAFLVHKSVLEKRRFIQLEYLEKADWPSSFSNVEFWSISDLAFDLPIQSTIGPRKSRRVSFLLSSFIRAVFSPLFSRILGLPLDVYLSWSVFGPIRRDLALRLRCSKNRLVRDR
jgi:hypothetical protein